MPFSVVALNQVSSANLLHLFIFLLIYHQYFSKHSLAITFVIKYTGRVKIMSTQLHHVKYLMDTDRIMKLRTPFKEIKINFYVTITTLPISPKYDLGGLGGHLKTFKCKDPLSDTLF